MTDLPEADAASADIIENARVRGYCFTVNVEGAVKLARAYRTLRASDAKVRAVVEAGQTAIAKVQAGDLSGLDDALHELDEALSALGAPPATAETQTEDKRVEQRGTLNAASAPTLPEGDFYD